MATYTDNLHLEKPAQSDLYNIDVFNGNADIIDSAMAARALAQNQATIEATSTASRNYSKGEFLVRNGLLYKVTSAIASGGTITPGTNCVATNTGAELSSLNDSIVNSAAYIPTGSAIDTYTASRCVFSKIGKVLLISTTFKLKSTAASGDTIIKYSDLGLTGNVVGDLQFGFLEAGIGVMAKVVAHRNDSEGGICIETLIGTFPSEKAVRGSFFFITN